MITIAERRSKWVSLYDLSIDVCYVVALLMEVPSYDVISWCVVSSIFSLDLYNEIRDRQQARGILYDDCLQFGLVKLSYETRLWSLCQIRIHVHIGGGWFWLRAHSLAVLQPEMTELDLGDVTACNMSEAMHEMHTVQCRYSEQSLMWLAIWQNWSDPGIPSQACSFCVTKSWSWVWLK